MVNKQPTDYFDLLELPRSFEVEQALLEQHYRKQQSQWHPDRFVNATDSERLAAVQRTSLLNDAYDSLRSPLRRLQHLLELQGVDTGALQQEELEAGFLYQQMEWREALQDHEQAEHEAALELLRAEVQVVLQLDQQNCVNSLENGRLQQAKQLFHKLQFLYKLNDEIREAEDRLLDY